MADIADMEGASFWQVCKAFNVKGYLFKIVSDTFENDTPKDIMKNIISTRDILFDFFNTEMIDQA